MPWLILVTFANPSRDMVHTYRGQRDIVLVTEEVWAMYPDAVACGAFNKDGDLRWGCVRGATPEEAFDTLFARSL